MTAKERREIITKHQKLWEEYKERNPRHAFLEDALRHLTGYYPDYGDKPEAFPVLCVPVTELEHPHDSANWCNYQNDFSLWLRMNVVGQKDDLKVFGVSCGKIPSSHKIFDEKGILEFLIGFKIDYVFGCISNDEDVEIEPVGIPFGAMAFRADQKIGEAFACIVNEYGGGLRHEDCSNWCFFESE